MEARGPNRHESPQTERTTFRLPARCPRPSPSPPCSPAYIRGGTGWRTQTFAMKACKPKRRPENTWKPAAPIKECKSNTSRTLSGNLPRRYCTAPRGLQLQPARRTARTRRAPHRRNASRSKTTTPYTHVHGITYDCTESCVGNPHNRIDPWKAANRRPTADGSPSRWPAAKARQPRSDQ
jgi:hypothetical protein